MTKDIKRLASRIAIFIYSIRHPGKPQDVEVNKKRLWRPWWIAATVGIVTLVVILALLRPTSGPTPMPTPSPTPIPEPTPKPLPPSPPSPTPQPVPTPSPIPQVTPSVPPEIEKGLLVLSHSTFIDSLGRFRVVGEVQNDGSGSTQKNRITVTFYDDQGVVALEGSNYCYLEILQPGKKSPFEVVFQSSPSTQNYKLLATWQPASKVPYRRFIFKDVSYQTSEDGSLLLTGKVTNSGVETAGLIAIVGSLYDSSNKIVDVGYTFCDVIPLPPGYTSSFSMLVHSRVAGLIQNYFLQAEGY